MQQPISHDNHGQRTVMAEVLHHKAFVSPERLTGDRLCRGLDNPQRIDTFDSKVCRPQHEGSTPHLTRILITHFLG